MADYDWFAPSAEQRKEEQRLIKMEHDNRMSTIHISSAVDTKFYMCNECATLLYHSEVAVTKHRSTYHPEPQMGKHADRSSTNASNG